MFYICLYILYIHMSYYSSVMYIYVSETVNAYITRLKILLIKLKHYFAAWFMFAQQKTHRDLLGRECMY